jgi:hypothetical protein
VKVHDKHPTSTSHNDAFKQNNYTQNPLIHDKSMKIKELNPAKKYKFKKTLMTEEIDKAIPCPIEDPRNPYHNDYLKLKELSDGHLKEASQIYENEPNSDLVGTKFIPEFYRPVDHRIHT